MRIDGNDSDVLRLAIFVAVFAAVAVWEIITPRRRLIVRRRLRWTNNLILATLNSLLLRVLTPLAAVGVANYVEHKQWGLLNLVQLPDWCAFLLAVLALDLLIWFQHRMFHLVPVFWCLHRVHHADLDFDLTTGVRFHPLEILISMAIKMTAVVALGVSPSAILTFEIVLSSLSIFNHANAGMPRALDRMLRYLIVTPDMHRIHHSSDRGEQNTNFGFNLAIWDRLFGSYRAQPLKAYEMMQIGLEDTRDVRRVQHLSGMLGLPFRSQ